MHSPTLAQWVGDLNAFAVDYWRKRPGIFTPASLRSPFGISDVDVVLASGLLRSPYIIMTRVGPDGDQQPVSCTSSRKVHRDTYEGYADEAKVHAQLGKGATLLLQRVDQWHAPTRDTLAALAAELNRRVEGFFFVTPAGGQGLALHRDDADVLVLQTAGSKKWYIHEGPATQDWLADRVPAGEVSEELLQVTLQPGQVLYIPRGFAHRATGAGGLSAHLSITIRDIGSTDLLRSLQRMLIEGLELTARPPDDAALDSAANAILDHFSKKLAEITQEHLISVTRQAQMDLLPKQSPGRTVSALA